MVKASFKQKLANYYYFIIINSFIACIVGIVYWFPGYTAAYIPIPQLTDTIAIVYSCCIHWLILTALTFLAGIIALPTIYLPSKVRLGIQTIVAAIFIAILFFDIGVFYSDAMHLTTIDFAAIVANLDMHALLKTNKIIAYSCCLFLVVLIYYVNLFINKSMWFTKNKIASKHLASIFILTIITTLIYFSHNNRYKQQLLAYTQRLPFCNSNNTIANKIKQTNKTILQGKIQYPLKQLQTIAINQPPNILIIGIDAWRADCFNATDSPNLWQFAQQGKIFTNHFSGANHTYGGLFSLFYGIPASYYNIFDNMQRKSLLFNRLKQLQYQLGIFTDNDNNKTLKLIIGYDNYNIINNPSISNIDIECDQQLTSKWITWYSKSDKNKPWFSFVFYDSLHSSDFKNSYLTGKNPQKSFRGYKSFATQAGKNKFIHSYKTCVSYLDSLANKILQQLKDNNDLENTIVIITADHGLEWNDYNQGNYGYRSNFTNIQVQVPLAIIYPQHNYFNKQEKHHKLTTHYDIVPTLMQNFLGVTSNTYDYSIGVNLLNNYSTDNFLCTQECQYGSSILGIITKNNILRINPNGSYNILNKFNQIIFDKINLKYINQALEYTTRFIKK